MVLEVGTRKRPKEREEDLRESLDFARRHLSHVKTPRRIDFRAELPRHDTGKLYKRLLRDEYWGKKTLVEGAAEAAA